MLLYDKLFTKEVEMNPRCANTKRTKAVINEEKFARGSPGKHIRWRQNRGVRTNKLPRKRENV